MQSFRVRSSFGPNSRPLIEFMGSDNASIRSILKSHFKQLNIKPISVEDLWQNDEIIEKFEWGERKFEVSYSTWDIQFIQEIGRSGVIQDIAKALNESAHFNQI